MIQLRAIILYFYARKIGASFGVDASEMHSEPANIKWSMR